MGSTFVTSNRLAAISSLLCLAGAAAAAQQQTVFKGGTRTVAVYTTVADQSGHLVPGLTRDDFEVFDNNKRQALTVFSSDPQPFTVVVMLDRSGSMTGHFALLRRAAEEFVDQMKPEDRARIGSFSERVQIDPDDFTSDRDALRKILRSDLQPAGPTPLWNAVDAAIAALRQQAGRRVVLVFTDGIDRPGTASYNNRSMKEVMKRAEEEDVMVYAIGLASFDIRGSRASHGGWGPLGGSGGLGGGGFGQMDTGKPDEGLPKIAAQTGGGYFELTSTDDLAKTFARVAEELHHQYVLGFTPLVLDGKMHKLEVKLRGGPKMARARRSYLAAKEGT